MSGDEPDEPTSRRGVLIAMVLLAALAAGGVWLSGVLRHTVHIQDCVMAGNMNCAPFN